MEKPVRAGEELHPSERKKLYVKRKARWATKYWLWDFLCLTPGYSYISGRPHAQHRATVPPRPPEPDPRNTSLEDPRIGAPPLHSKRRSDFAPRIISTGCRIQFELYVDL